MPIDIPIGIVMALSVYLAAWLFKKSDLGFGKEGWKWMVTGSTIFLVTETMWRLNWDFVGLGGINNILNWIQFGLNLFGWLMIVFGVIKLVMSMLSEDDYPLPSARP